MRPSARAVEFVKGFEKCRLKAYKPTPNDKWTCGWGATEGVTKDTVWTQEEADRRFDRDAAAFAGSVTSMLGGNVHGTSQNQFDAMFSLAYNIGTTNFKRSSVLANHRAGRYSTAALAFQLWNKQTQADGTLKVLNGLTKRRKAEAAMYRGEG